MLKWIRPKLHRLIDWVMDRARRDPDVSLDEYRELEREANKTRAYIDSP